MHRMSSLFINSGTYSLCSILLFFQQNLSIYYLRLATKNNSPSFFKANSNYYYNQKQEELAMFSHTHISIGQWKTFGWTIMGIFVGKMFYYIMNCRINWSQNKRGVLQVFNSLHTLFRGYLGQTHLIRHKSLSLAVCVLKTILLSQIFLYALITT